MSFIRSVHTFSGFFVFIVVFIVLFPLLSIPILFPSQFKLTGIINRWWAKLLFTFIFIPFEVEERTQLDRNGVYIFCPNHFSYLDIPTMGLNPVNTIFVGKNAIEKIPLFGFMYRKLHITVDRLSLRSRGNTMIASMNAIDQGKSLVIYPEGGIITHHPPTMVAFKDGAFRTAIEKQIAIVPVTIPHNWKILPDQNPLSLRFGKVKVIFHEPVETKGMRLSDVDELKHKVFQIIDHELKQQNSLSAVSSHS
jgi:1-acyl-sn-glycerol-3-phosphate acyltransferase